MLVTYASVQFCAFLTVLFATQHMGRQLIDIFFAGRPRATLPLQALYWTPGTSEVLVCASAVLFLATVLWGLLGSNERAVALLLGLCLLQLTAMLYVGYLLMALSMAVMSGSQTIGKPEFGDLNG